MECIQKDELAASRNEWRLIQRVIAVSESKIWQEAKKEWDIIGVYMDDDYDTCTCGHYPIKEIIIVKNRYNQNELIIGNCCINKFFDFDFKGNRFFSALAKGKINQVIIDRGITDNVINGGEYIFLSDVWRKRKVTDGQYEKFQNLSKRLIEFYTKNCNNGKKDDNGKEVKEKIEIKETTQLLDFALDLSAESLVESLVDSSVESIPISINDPIKYIYTVYCKKCDKKVELLLEPIEAHEMVYKKHSCGTYLSVQIGGEEIR